MCIAVAAPVIAPHRTARRSQRGCRGPASRGWCTRARHRPATDRAGSPLARHMRHGTSWPAPQRRSSVRRVTGWSITPSIGVSPSSSAISVPKVGRPLTNARVPSIGSSTQRNCASGRSRPNSSPRIPWSGNRSAQNRAHRLFRAAVGDRHRRAIGFLIDTQAGAKERPHHGTGNVGRGLRRCDQQVRVRSWQPGHATKLLHGLAGAAAAGAAAG